MPSERDARGCLRSEFAGDPDMRELIRFFVSEMPERIRAVEACLREDRLDDLRVIAHQLKGASAGYGFAPVGLAARALEEDLKDSAGLEAIRRDVESLLGLCRRVGE